MNGGIEGPLSADPHGHKRYRDKHQHQRSNRRAAETAVMKRALACLLLGCLPSWSLDVGFDFRATQSFVTDPAYAAFAATASYPTALAINGQQITFGWELRGSTYLTSNHNAAIDPRLAGMSCQANDGNTSVFRVDLPSTGAYSIGLAAGDSSGNTQINYIEISSAATGVLSVHAVTGATSSPDMADASGLRWGLAAWPGSNVAVQKTFASTILRLTLGGTVDGAYTCVAHMRVTSVQAAAPVTSAWQFLIQ
jgi:hypothetical protein